MDLRKRERDGEALVINDARYPIIRYYKSNMGHIPGSSMIALRLIITVCGKTARRYWILSPGLPRHWSPVMQTTSTLENYSFNEVGLVCVAWSSYPTRYSSLYTPRRS